MSQSGKQFLSGLMNRVFRSSKESRSAIRRRERSLSARRLGMEPLEDRQLLAVDPTLLAAVDAGAAQTSTEQFGPTVEFDLANLTRVTKTATPNVSVSNGAFEETTLASTSETFQITVDGGVSNAIISENGVHSVASDISAHIDRWSCNEMGWAATVSNLLTYAGWGETLVDSTSGKAAEDQIFDYFTENFTNEASSLLYGVAWFMNGENEYVPQGQNGWSQIYNGATGGNLYPSDNGDYLSYTSYCQEILASDIPSPLYGITSEYLDNNYGVGVEVRYAASGTNVDVVNGTTNQPQKTWLTLWGYEYNDAFKPIDKEYYTAVLVSNPETGAVERCAVQWDNVLKTYSFVNYGRTDASTAYIYSFTTLSRMPGYGVLDNDAYEPNNSSVDFVPGAKADLGKIDVVTGGSSGEGVDAAGNTIVLENLSLHESAVPGKLAADPADYYKFELTQTASNSDAIFVDFGLNYLNSALKATLYVADVDGEIHTLDPTILGFVSGRFDAVSSKVEEYNPDSVTGKTVKTTYYREAISLAGLPAGQYYLKVEFADGVVDGVNQNYKVTFNAGFDDRYESNDTYEEVDEAPVSTAANPTGNLGVLFDSVVLSDLILKQYAKNEVSEVDWFRFEMTSVGAPDSNVKLHYETTKAQLNDTDLDIYLYRAGEDKPVKISQSGPKINEIEELSLADLPAGVYYVKVVGFKNASNVGYKLEINPGVCDVPDMRAEIPTDSLWEAPLVVTSRPFTFSSTEVFENEAIIGNSSDIYLNYSFGVSANAKFDGAKLALYINGKLVDPIAVRDALLSDANKSMSAATRTKLLALFTDANGLNMAADESIVVSNFNIGRISDATSLAGTYFSDAPQAKNSVVFVINPSNYDLGAFYAPDGTEPYAFEEGDLVVASNGQKLVYENGKFVAPNGSVVETKVGDVLTLGTLKLTKRFGEIVDAGSKYVVKTDYTAKEGVEKTREYIVDNNFSTAFFILNNLGDDNFAPNATPVEAVDNTNSQETNPDLGVANVENLTPQGQNAAGEMVYARTIENLTINSNKSDWFKFSLLSSSVDPIPNYSNGYVQITTDPTFAALGLDNAGDLDLQLYKVVQNDPSVSFEEAYRTGAYRLVLVGESLGVKTTERISFADSAEINDGTYFVRVLGFNGSTNRYALELGGFTASGKIDPTDPNAYFNDDSVSIVNSVATLVWQTPASDYVSKTTIEYRLEGASTWTKLGEFDKAVSSCKVAGLKANSKYEFRLTVSNFFASGVDAPSAIVAKQTDDFFNEVVYRAVIVGVSDYPGTSADLVAAANDADAFYNALLKDPQWAKENITLLKDSAATNGAVYNALNQIADVSDDNDVFVFYFAGSGLYRVNGGEIYGYLKTYGSSTKEYISNVDLLASVEKIAAGSKQFILDAGQVPLNDDSTTIKYDAFIASLTNSVKNGASARVAQSTVLTAGANGQVSKNGVARRSYFNLALVEGIEKYAEVVTAEDAALANKAATDPNAEKVVESDGRVALAELADYLQKDETLKALGATPLYATNSTFETVLANGVWREDAAFADRWADERAIVVTTTVDCVDPCDGKVSLREAERLIGTTVEQTSQIAAKAKFTLGAGSLVTIGATAGTLEADAILVYENGAFKTFGTCSIRNAQNKLVDFKSGNVVTWTDENWSAGSVSLTDDENLTISKVEFGLNATYGSVLVENSLYNVTVELAEGDLLQTALVGGKDVVVKKVGSSLGLYYVEGGAEYTRLTGLYFNGEAVNLARTAAATQEILLNKIVFDDALVGESITVDPTKGPIVFDKGATIDATSLKGTLGIDGQGSQKTIEVVGTELVSIIGVKILGGVAGGISVAEGAKFELANSLVVGCDGGADGVVANSGSTAIVNVTFANNKASNALVVNAATGTLKIANSLFALNEGVAFVDASGAFALDATNVELGAVDGGFVDAANGDYRLTKTSPAIDLGSNVATFLECGIALDYDLAGSARVEYGSVDAGAFEFEADPTELETPSTVVTTFDDVVDFTDGQISLREAIQYAGTTYSVESVLKEGDVVTTADGVQLEVKNGKLVAFEGVVGTQTGMFYLIEGVYVVDQFGSYRALAEGDVATLADGTSATVVGAKLLPASGVPVAENTTITLADGTSGALSYGAVVDFVKGEKISVALTTAAVENLLPAGTAFDAGTYVAEFQTNGTFQTTVNVTTVDANNVSTTAAVDVTFTLVEGTVVSFLDEQGAVSTTAKIVATRTVALKDGTYTLASDLTETIAGKTQTIYAAGAQLKLVRGVFTDADGKVVSVPRGTALISPTGANVAYRSSSFVAVVPEVGDKLTLADGTIREFKEDLTVYDSVKLTTNVTFAPGLSAGKILLQRGAIDVDKAVSIDANTIGGLTIDAQNASRVFNVNTYRETSATASVNFAGMTLINGAADQGGLINVAANTNFKLVDSTLRDASADQGGAIYNAGKLTIESSSKPVSISQTKAAQGGSIYNLGTLTVSNASIVAAVATGDGGAIYNLGTANLSGATVTGNKAAQNGGAVYNAGLLSATRSAVISSNSAENGGAVYNVGTFNVNNAKLVGSTATGDGGAIYNAGTAAKVSLTSATLSGNKAADGGAIYNSAQFFATRSVFAGNTATNGSALWSNGEATFVNSLVLANDGTAALLSTGSGTLFLANDTIVGNKGNGVNSNGQSLTVYNSIVGDNNGVDLAGTTGAFDLRYNMVENASLTLDSTNADVYKPDFANFAGDDWTQWSLRLSSGSYAVDKGSADFAYYYNFNGAKVVLTTDYADAGRLTGASVDIGAYEIDTSVETASTVVTTLDDVYDPYDGLISLREAAMYAAKGVDEATRTVTFSSDLFEFSNSGTVKVQSGTASYLDPYGGTALQSLGTIVLNGSIIITSEYVDEFGKTAYRDITIDGQGDSTLFMKTGFGDVELRGLTLTNGYASGVNPNGGAVLLRDGSLSIVDCVVTGNKSQNDGGALYQEGGVLLAVNSLFYGNVAGRYGGMIRAEGGQTHIYNATIAENSAQLYGGVYSEQGLVTMANSIVANNGGAQAVDVRATNLVAFANLIGGMDEWYTVDGFGGNVVGSAATPVDPMFDSAATGLARFKVQSGSLAINAGLNEYANGVGGIQLKRDLIGNVRVNGGVVDIGAFESAYQDVPSTVVTTLVDVVDQSDGYVSLREAISFAKILRTPITFDLDDQVTEATIRLDSALGSLDIVSETVIDASKLSGGLTIVGDDSRIFNVYKSGTSLADGTQTTVDGDLTLFNVALTGGKATDGGALYMNGGRLEMTNCVVYGNEATRFGGAFYITGGDAKFLNCTIAANEAPAISGVYFGNALGTLTLQNSIVAANATENSASADNYDLYSTGTVVATAAFIGSAPIDFAAAFNGVNGVSIGTPNGILDAGFNAAESYDFTLKSDSPAVNKGSNRLIGQSGYYSSILMTGSNVRVLLNDFAGSERLVGGTVDIGAYEFQTATEAPSAVVTTIQDVVDPFDGLISLREAIDYAGSAYYVNGLVSRVGTTVAFDSALAGKTIELTETLELTKCVTIDATGLTGGLTLDAGGKFAVVKIDAVPDALSSVAALVGLTITGGSADSGAGVYHVGGDALLLNCVVYGNEATYGAGVRSDDGSLKIANTTITKNEASLYYGGLYANGGDVSLQNALIAKNTVDGEAGADCFVAAFVDVRGSLIGSTSYWVAAMYNGVDGNFVGAPSSPIEPGFVDWDKNDFSLLNSSVALNGGDNLFVVRPDGTIPTTDVVGNLRFVDGTVDIGAYESSTATSEIPSLIVTTAEDVVDARDGFISLREAVAYANNYGLGKTITFAPSINGSTIYLKETLEIGVNLTIDGLANGATGIVLTTADDVFDQRILYVDAGDVVLNGLTLTNRYTERLQKGLDELQIAEGGAVYVRSGSVSIYNSYLIDNAADVGSAIYVNEQNEAATATLVNCTVVNNTATNATADGAAIHCETGVLNLWNTIVANNKTVVAGVAQDVYKGASANKTVLQTVRTTDQVEIEEFDADAFAFIEGENVTFAGTRLTYREGAFYNAAGAQTTFVAGQTITAYRNVTILLGTDGIWRTNGDVVYSLEPQNGDAFQLIAADGTVETLYYVNGEYRLNNYYGAIYGFETGDSLVVAERQTLTYNDDAFHQTNVVQSTGGWFRRTFKLTPAAQREIEADLIAELQQNLRWQTTFTTIVNGVEMTYQILDADVTLTGFSSEVGENRAEGDAGYDVTYTYAATYTFQTNQGVSVLHSFVSYSDSLSTLVSGNGSFIGSAAFDLSVETDALFVDPENGDYHLKDDSLATNNGNNIYFNQGTINGTFDSFDLERNSRIYYTTTDMGAFENQNAQDAPVTNVAGNSVQLTVTTGKDTIDPSDGATSLREALAMADRLYVLGYDNIQVVFADDYNLRLETTCLTVNVPVTIYGSNATIDCDFSNCAFLVATDGAVTIENLTIVGGVGLNGGGVKLTDGDLTLVEVLIYNCEATAVGGGVYSSTDGLLSIYNSTIANNVGGDGSGIYATDATTVRLYNSIVAKNRSSKAGATPVDVVFNGDFNVYYSLLGSVGSAATVAKINAKSVNSKIGYGDANAIDPMFINVSEGNYRISATASPALRAGASRYVYPGSSDLAGNWLGNYAAPSMGAYQVGVEERSTIVTTLEDVVDETDGLISLREAIAYAEDNMSGAGCGSVDDSAYAAADAPNNAGVYRTVYYSPITFDKTLAGGTIRLNAELGGFTFARRADTGQVFDYMIDASALSELGGITIDASAVHGGGFGGQAVINVNGNADTDNGLYWAVNLDIRNVAIVGQGGTGFLVNRFGILSVRNCLIEGFDDAVAVRDDDSAQGGVAHVYGSTLVGNVSVGGKLFLYNSIVTGSVNVSDATNDPAYRTVAIYNSYYQRRGGLTGRISNNAGTIYNGTVNDLFVDAANGDYRLARFSICVNTGDNVYLRTLEQVHADGEVDLNGNPRVVNNVVDMGCYERAGLVDVPSTVVTTVDDVVDQTDGVISIREAIAYAEQNSGLFGNTVTFSDELDGETIVLKNGALNLTRYVALNGGAVDVTIDGAGKSSIFDIAIAGGQTSNVNDVRLYNLSLTNGKTEKSGGAITISKGNVYMSGLQIYNCSAAQYGGAIYAENSELTLVDCLIGGNTATYYGGVVNQFGKTVLMGCYIAENVGLVSNADIWGAYPKNYANSKNNVIGFVTDVLLYDGVDGNRIGTKTNPIKPFVAATVGNLTIKAEAAWQSETSNALLDDAFALFDDEEEGNDAIAEELDAPELNVFDDDFFAEIEL